MLETLINIPNDLIPYTLCLDSEGVPLGGWYLPIDKAAEEMLQAGRVFVERPYTQYPVGERLTAYFEGEQISLDMPLRLTGTDFQRRVWNEMTRIPYGTVVSYGELARRIGSRAYRAVGQACHRNPLPLIVPCHRVIASGGRLGGFGGGEDIKRLLLRFEGVDPMPA